MYRKDCFNDNKYQSISMIQDKWDYGWLKGWVMKLSL